MYLLMLVERPASLSWRALLPTNAAAEAAGGCMARWRCRGALNHRWLTLPNAVALVRRRRPSLQGAASDKIDASRASVSGAQQTARCVSGTGCLLPAEGLGRCPRATLKPTMRSKVDRGGCGSRQRCCSREREP